LPPRKAAPHGHLYPTPPLAPGWTCLVNQTCPSTSSFCSLGTVSSSFDSPFGVLFNFPSQYFSAIGLCVIFRFSRNLPAALRCTHKQHDSKRGSDLGRLRVPWDYHPLWCGFPANFKLFDAHQLPLRKEHRGEPVTEHPPFPLICFLFEGLSVARADAAPSPERPLLS